MPSLLRPLQYLVGTGTFIDLARQGSVSVAWASSLRFEECGLSVVSIGQALSRAEQMDPASAARNNWFSNIKLIRSRFEQHDGVIGVDMDIATTWSKIRHLDLQFRDADGNMASLNPDHALVLATAIELDLVLLETQADYHKAVAPLGLRVQDPPGLVVKAP